MTRDKVISFIDGKINTTAVLSIVEQKAAELDYTTENNQLGRWYASCYKMLKEASWSLVNFKLRVAENALTRQYVLLTSQFEDTLMSEVQPLRKSVWEKVDAFIKDNGNLGIDPEDLSYTISELIISDYYTPSMLIDQIVEELNDTLDLIKLKAYLRGQSKSGKCNQTNLITISPQNPLQSNYKIKSKRANLYFSKILVDYFIDRYIITDNEQTIKENINNWNAYRPKIWHRLIHDIYHFFANKGLLHYNNKNDTYHLGERDGKFASLNGEVSEWIYNLLCEFYEKKDNKTSARFDIYNGRKDKIDAIKNWRIGQIAG